MTPRNPEIQSDPESKVIPSDVKLCLLSLSVVKGSLVTPSDVIGVRRGVTKGVGDSRGPPALQGMDG
jgi:hypothetical protein